MFYATVSFWMCAENSSATTHNLFPLVEVVALEKSAVGEEIWLQLFTDAVISNLDGPKMKWDEIRLLHN